MIRFSKMQGLGNDFVVIDAINQTVRLTPEQIRFLANRHLGVGCDQVLLVEPAQRPDCDFHYRIFNSDGSEVGQCGNGARCFARFVRDQGLTARDQITACTASGVLRMSLENGNLVTVGMGVPQFEPAAIPFLADGIAPSYPLDLDGERVDVGVVSMGNPHAVLVVADVTRAPVAQIGARLGRDQRFPQGVNAGFMEILDPAHIRLRVFERGVGETLACGSGACAAVAVGRQRDLLQERVAVELPGGTLLVQWPGGAESVSMTGPATHVFEGRIQL